MVLRLVRKNRLTSTMIPKKKIYRVTSFNPVNVDLETNVISVILLKVEILCNNEAQIHVPVTGVVTRLHHKNVLIKNEIVDAHNSDFELSLPVQFESKDLHIISKLNRVCLLVESVTHQIL